MANKKIDNKIDGKTPSEIAHDVNWSATKKAFAVGTGIFVGALGAAGILTTDMPEGNTSEPVKDQSAIVGTMPEDFETSNDLLNSMVDSSDAIDESEVSEDFSQEEIEENKEAEAFCNFLSDALRSGLDERGNYLDKFDYDFENVTLEYNKRTGISEFEINGYNKDLGKMNSCKFLVERAHMVEILDLLGVDYGNEELFEYTLTSEKIAELDAEALATIQGILKGNFAFDKEEGEEEVVLPNEGSDIPAEAPESDENKENNADKPLYENEFSKNDKVDSICHQFNNFMDDIFNIQDWGSNSLEHKFIGFEIDYDADYQNGTLTIDGYCKDTKQIGSASWMLNEEQATKLLKLLGYNQQALPHESVNGYKASIDVLEGRSFEELFEIELILKGLQADLEEIISNENIKG